MKVLAIASSPRRHGNSETLLDSALKGIRSKNADTEKVVLRDLNLYPCQGCGRCSVKGSCKIRDDMRFLLTSIRRADAVIIASPVYFGSVTALLKIMIDRCQVLWAENALLKKRVQKKRAGTYIIVSSYNNSKFFRNSKEILRLFFKVSGFEEVAGIFVPGMEKRYQAKRDSAAKNKAFMLGKRVAKKIDSDNTRA